MTADLVDQFAAEHGISKLRDMVVITELLGNRKAPAGTGAIGKAKDMVDGFSIDEMEWIF